MSELLEVAGLIAISLAIALLAGPAWGLLTAGAAAVLIGVALGRGGDEE